MIGRNSVMSLQKVATIAYTSLSLLLSWLGVIVGFGLLVVGILGAIAGQLVWSIAWAGVAAARARLAGLLPGRMTPETGDHVHGGALPDSQAVDQRSDIQ